MFDGDGFVFVGVWDGGTVLVVGDFGLGVGAGEFFAEDVVVTGFVFVQGDDAFETEGFDEGEAVWLFFAVFADVGDFVGAGAISSDDVVYEYGSNDDDCEDDDGGDDGAEDLGGDAGFGGFGRFGASGCGAGFGFYFGGLFGWFRGLYG